MIRKKLIAGNWKMNKTSADASTLVQEIVAEVGRVTDVDILVCPLSPRSKAPASSSRAPT
jgi:triosephosphate isomerase